MDAGALRPLRLVRARPGDAAAVLGPLRLVLAAGAVPTLHLGTWCSCLSRGEMNLHLAIVPLVSWFMSNSHV